MYVCLLKMEMLTKLSMTLFCVCLGVRLSHSVDSVEWKLNILIPLNGNLIFLLSHDVAIDRCRF